MTFRFKGILVVPAAIALIAGGCANDGTLTTAAINSASPTAAKTASSVDPACTTLASQIDSLRKEGAVEGLEKAAAGKGASVKVKREALAKQAELNRANAEFQTKCGPKIPSQQAAQAAPAAPAAATAAAQVAPVAAKAAKTAAEAVAKP